MDVLVIGSGGREHAICHSLTKSTKINKLYALPGNAGISEIAECINFSVTDFDNILNFLNNNKNIEMTVVAPDDPLALGLVDFLEKHGHRAFGPNKAAALIEASKAFSKYLMKKYDIPTAEYEEFDDYEKALQFINSAKYPLVVKADGLALGKGVIICNDLDEGRLAIKEIMVDGKFQQAGKKIIVEEFLVGREVSVLCFTDGKTIKPMVSSQDHKRALDDDKGLNTGGMGTFSPSQVYTKGIADDVYDSIIVKTIRSMESEGRPFKGVLYFGLMLTDKGVKVIEYNARFGDPEAQVVLPRLKTDLLDIFNSIIDGELEQQDIEWEDNCAVCVILASGGYPEAYEKGKEIIIGKLDGAYLYHAGTSFKNGKLVTNGGRVLGVTAIGKTIEDARKIAYKNIENIKFENMHFRNDIGRK